MWSRKLTSINVSNNTALASLRKPLPLCQAPVTSIDSRTVIKRALMNIAQGFILPHNHPSGNPLPSLHGTEWTSKLRKACDLMDINLMDHIILEGLRFYLSFCFSVDN